MDFYGNSVYWVQSPSETFYKYFERFKQYSPRHGCPFHESIRAFIHGMLLEDRYILDMLGGRSIMDCSPRQAWYLIDEMAACTKPYDFSEPIYDEYIEYNSEQAHLESLEEMVSHPTHAVSQLAQAVQQADEREKKLPSKLDENMSRLAALRRASPELSLEPTQFSLDDSEALVEKEEQGDEDVMEEALQVVPSPCIEDVPSEDLNSPQCSDIIIKQNTVITCNPTFPPISNTCLSSLVQGYIIREALCSNNVWGVFERVQIHMALIKELKQLLYFEKFLVKLLINWKKRKKESQIIKNPDSMIEKLNGVCTNSKMCTKDKRMNLKEGISKSFHSKRLVKTTFGWKPGWDSWRGVSDKAMKKGRRSWRKFDGVHPWAPNIR